MKTIVCMSVVLLGCAGTKTAPPVIERPGQNQGAEKSPFVPWTAPAKQESQTKTEDATPNPPSPIYFDFDKYEVRENSGIESWVAYIVKFDPLPVILTGHCDERGTPEYNLSLGLRRAQAVRDQLVRLGVDPGRLICQTAGEESPACPGHDEWAWAQNRRCVVIQSGE